MKSFEGNAKRAAELQSDDALWQRAANEGWPDLQQRSPPSAAVGRIAPRMALAAPHNGVGTVIGKFARRGDRHAVD